MTPQQKIALILCVFSSTTYAGPFITNATAPQVIQQPLAVNPEVKALCYGTRTKCHGGLPLASPHNSSVGIVSAFVATHLSQANPNSPTPATTKTCAQWTWSGKDNTGWTCTAVPRHKPAPQPTAQPQTVNCTGIINTFYCTAGGYQGTITSANGQPACRIDGSNTAVLNSNGQTVTCN
jgi:hypothetical protein